MVDDSIVSVAVSEALLPLPSTFEIVLEDALRETMGSLGPSLLSDARRRGSRVLC